jgi:hypothetical protein
MKVAYNNITTEGAHIFSDFASVTRLMLADAAELVEVQAGKAKETLRHVERDVQQGKRDSLGRDKEVLEAESSDARVTWEHGMDTVKDTGSMMIGASQTVSGAVEDKAERTASRLQNAFYSVSPSIPVKVPLKLTLDNRSVIELRPILRIVMLSIPSSPSYKNVSSKAWRASRILISLSHPSLPTRRPNSTFLKPWNVSRLSLNASQTFPLTLSFGGSDPPSP